jgi:hypothetical protein
MLILLVELDVTPLSKKVDFAHQWKLLGLLLPVILLNAQGVYPDSQQARQLFLGTALMSITETPESRVAVKCHLDLYTCVGNVQKILRLTGKFTPNI